MTRPANVQAAIALMQVYMAAEGLAEQVDDITAYIESLESQGWRTDFENAPLDGTPVDLWMTNYFNKEGFRLQDCKWNGREWRNINDDTLILCQVTHWRYPPTAPSTDTTQGE